MSRMGEYVLDHPAPDTDLEDCDFAQFERELRADPAWSDWLEQLQLNRNTQHVHEHQRPEL